MGLFSRRRRGAADEEHDDARDEAALTDPMAWLPEPAGESAGSAASADSAPSAESTDDAADTADSAADGDSATGPWDASDAPERENGRIDLGAVRIPPVDGMQLRLESADDDGEATAVVLVLGGSTLELRAFAAPRTEGIWEELRRDIIEELRGADVFCEELDGPSGKEVLARIPVTTPDGQSGVVPARFIGADGPRWFLRGVLQGRAATEDEASEELRAVFADVVVARDGAARPPREILPLHAPGAVTAIEAEDLPGLDPLQPGPTIAEIR